MKCSDDENLLNQAVQRLKDDAQEVSVPEDLVRATLQAMNRDSRQLTSILDAADRKRSRWVWYSSTMGLTAVVAVMIFVGLSTRHVSAWEKAIETVQRSEVVHLASQLKSGLSAVTQPSSVTPSPVVQPPNEQQVTITRNKLRVDGIGGHLSWVIDQEAKAALIIDERARQYQTVDMSQGGIVPFGLWGTNVREDLLALRDQKPELMGTEMLKGESVDRYVIKNGKVVYCEGDWEIWISRRTDLPVKVKVEMHIRGLTTVIEYDSFDWNPVIDAKTFSVDPIPGFEEADILQVVPRLPHRQLLKE